MPKGVKKHIAPPLTAEQISRGVGVTPRDARIVKKVLRDLGFIKEENPSKSSSPRPRKN
jgi:hypothetical protein